MRFARSLVLGGSLLAGALALAMPHVLAQDAKPQPAAPQGAPSGRGGAGSMAGGNELAEALKATPGCLGVEVAFTQSRKAVIFAWFQDKKATLDWYYSDYHQTAMMGLRDAAAESGKKGELPYAVDEKQAVEQEEREPLQEIADDSGPILCIATITPLAPGQKPLVPGFPQPISQISIELYQPLPGGIAFNGRFAPATVKVPHLVEMSATPEPKPAAPAAPAAGSGK